ncbi:hypothetical protein SAMN05421747_1414, partial [Parapedobacter composti]
ILSLLERFYSSDNNQSIYSLLRNTGYFESHSNINENSIKEALEQHPQYVDQWLQWSEDKRVDSGWFFFIQNDRKYLVGFLDADKGTTEKMEYSDRKSACAVFIKRELESIRIG